MTDPTIKTLDLQRMWLASGLVFAFVAALAAMLLRAVPEANKDIVVYMIGQLSGMATMALSFYFINKAGQDAADAKKTENTGKMADAITAAAAAGGHPIDAKDAAVDAADQVAGAAEAEASRIAEGGGPPLRR